MRTARTRRVAFDVRGLCDHVVDQRSNDTSNRRILSRIDVNLLTMDRLWSPWRSVHVATWGERDETDRAAVFERLAASTDDDRDFVLWRGRLVMVVMNIHPYNNGHLMIAPYRRVVSYEELTGEEQLEISETLSRCIGWLRSAVSPDGFNVGMNLGVASGAAIPQHLHVHVVPRWSGDTSFMASTADIRVIPEAMRDTFEKLKAVIRIP